VGQHAGQEIIEARTSCAPLLCYTSPHAATTHHYV
jgi:hypothetical protein